MARCALGVATLLVTSMGGRAQTLQAPQEPGHVLGRVCVDENDDGVCQSEERGLPGALVFTDDGLTARTDRYGRYHLGDVGRRSFALTPSGGAYERLRHVAVKSDTGALGPGARARGAVIAPVFPGGVVRVDLPVSPPRWLEAPPLVVGADAGHALRLMAQGERVIARVPARVPPGHSVLVDGVAVPVDAEGGLVMDVPVGARGGLVHLADGAPDGRVRVTRVRIARVPRPRGGELVLVEEVRWLASFDLPPPSLPVAAGALSVPFRVAPGVAVSWLAGAAPARDGALLLEVPTVFAAKPTLSLQVPEDGGRALEVQVPLDLVVDPLVGARWLAFGDLRAGLPVAPFGVAGAGVDGRVGSVASVPLSGLFGGALGESRVEAVVDVEDTWVADALAGDLGYGARASAGWARFLEDDDVALFADESQTSAQNPASLPFTARVVGEQGAIGVGAARTGLEAGEVGRFDRAVIGPYVDVEQPLGPVTLSLRGGADASTAPYVSGSFARAAHAELLGTGGVVYRLPQRELVPGSERLWVEVRDPLTGLVKHRRALVRGRDYDVDYPSGLIVLASPLGREGAPFVGQLAASGLAFETRLVADYHASTFDPASGGSFGGRAALEALGVEVGVRGAGESELGYWLGGVDVEAAPFPWLALTASAAGSAGDPFTGEDAFLISRDGGASFRAPHAKGAPAQGGAAYAARARVGDADDGASLWATLIDAGYRDSARASDQAALQVGGEGNLTLGSSRFGLFGDWREGPVPKGLLDDGARAAVRVGGVRVEQPVGSWFTVAVEGHARQVDLERSADTDEGAAAGAGVEVVWHAHDKLDLLASHLQGLFTTGEGPGARDLTFSQVGARFHDDDGSVEARAGLAPDGTLAGSARFHRLREDGATSYGGFDLSPDDVFAPRGLSSVSGARQAAAPGAAVFTESRLVDDPFFGLSHAQAVGGELGGGPLRLVASWERSRRFLDVTDGWEGAHAQIGFSERHLAAQTFGEVSRALEDTNALASDGLTRWFAGSAARLELMRDLTLGGRVLVGRPAPDQRTLSLARLGLGFRRPSWPVLLTSYQLRQDLPGIDEGDAPLLRQHVGLASAGVHPWPFLSVLLSTRARVTEVLDDGGDTVLATQAGVVALRTGVLLFDLVEPAVELGARALTGAELPLETDLTARLEGVVVLGPVRVGAGFVLHGFTGTGLEEPRLDPPARLYAVLQGAL